MSYRAWICEGCGKPDARMEVEAPANQQLIGELRDEVETLRRALRPFAKYCHVLEIIRCEEAKAGFKNGWDNLDPILGAKGQLLTLGDFRHAHRVMDECNQVEASRS